MDDKTNKELKQRNLDTRYMRMATIWAENSYCKRRQVGALLVKDKMIISDGYNGTPSGFDNNCEDENKSGARKLSPDAEWIYENCSFDNFLKGSVK